jgi:hypothetical protein
MADAVENGQKIGKILVARAAVDLMKSNLCASRSSVSAVCMRRAISSSSSWPRERIRASKRS